MSQVMIVVEFETKPEHRSQFIDLMSRSGATRRRSMPTRRGRCRVTPTKTGSSAAKSHAARRPISSRTAIGFALRGAMPRRFLHGL
jgi:hypothetical protein